VRNDTDYFVELWIYRHELNSWKSVDLGRRAEIRLEPRTHGLCTLVAREPPSQDYRLGTFDLKQIAAKNANPVLKISLVFESRVVQEGWFDQYGRYHIVQSAIIVHVIKGQWENVK